MTVLDPIAIYERGLDDPDSLNRFELLVYLVQEIENCSEMEGWDHFFICRRPQDSEALRKMLHEIGDAISAEVIDDYANHLRQIGVTFPPPELPCLACIGDRDWVQDFANATEQRWNKVGAFLLRHGLELAQRGGEAEARAEHRD